MSDVAPRVTITVYYKRGDRYVAAHTDVDAELAAFLEAAGPSVLAHPMCGWRPTCADLHLLLEGIEHNTIPGPADLLDDTGEVA